MNNIKVSLVSVGLSAVLLVPAVLASATWLGWPEQVRDQDSREFVVAETIMLDASAPGLSAEVIGAKPALGSL